MAFTLGFIGLGTMGTPMVRNLLKGYTVRVWARTGKLRSRKNPGGRVLVFRRADVEALLEDGDEPSEFEAVPGTPHAAQTERRAGDYSTDPPQSPSLTGQSSEGTTAS